MMIAIVLILTVFVGVLAAAETALTASSRIKLHHLRNRGDARAGLVLELQSQMGRVISTILLANTWCMTSMTALVTGVLTLWFGAIGTIYAAAFLSFFITIYLEVTPKLLAFQNPEKVALALVGGVNILRWVLSPVTGVIDRLARFSLKLLGIKPTPNSQSATLEELHGAIDLHIGDGTVAHERRMLKNILDLTQVSVAQVMVHRNKMFALDIQAPLATNLAQIFQAPYTRIPLWQHNPDNIIGLLHTKALLHSMKRASSHEVSHDALDLLALTSAPWFIPETTSLLTQLQSFREKKAHLAFVVDEYGSLQGMVTLEDILEEIVGDIVDEHDIELPGVRFADGCYMIQGTVSLRDLNRQYTWQLPEDKATTLAGLLLEESGHIPEEGMVFTLYGLEITVLQRHRNQLTLLRVKDTRQEIPAHGLPSQELPPQGA